MKNINKIKKLVKQECSCYFGGAERNYCCKHDKTCYFFWDSDVLFDKNNFQNYRCNYFEESVLPMDTQLELEYKKEFNLDTSNLVKCANCKKPFKMVHHNQKYCSYCAAFLKKESSRKSIANKRSKL